jgi:putative DNA primase/helicase
MSSITATLNLTPTDIEVFQKLRVPVELLEEAGIRRVTDREARNAGIVRDRSARLEGVLFPYFRPTGEIVGCRVRRDHPEIDATTGKPKQKYLSSYGDRKHFYLLPADGPFLQDITVPIVFVEAEKSKLSIMAAAQNLGRCIFAIGLGGCWGWRGRIGTAPSADGARVDVKGPIPDFDCIAWTNREVFICLDSNVVAKTEVQAAERGLRYELAERGANVRLITIPQEPGINGPDDFIGTHGYEAFLELLDRAETDRWREPLPLVATLDVAAPYPLDAMPKVMRGAVEEVAAFTKAPLPLVASSALTVLSIAGQSYIDVARADKLTGPSGLFLLTIADSGERKTTVDGFFSTAIHKYDDEQAQLAEPEQQRYKAAIGAWEAERSGIQSAIQQGAKVGNPPLEPLRQKLTQLEESQPQAPRVPKLLRGDDTPESLAWTLSHSWPAAGVLTSEAGAVLGSHSMKPENIMRNLSLLNILWDGGKLPIGRKTSESFTVRGARLTLGLQVQPLTIRTFFEKSGGLARGSGFLARFLIAWPESTQGYRPFTEPPKGWPLLTKFNERIAEILKEPAPIDETGGLTPKMLSLSPDAKVAWIAFHDAVEGKLRAGGELVDVRDVASKTADNAVRIAALFHIFNKHEGTICLECFEGSRTAAWHLNESRRFFGELALPTELRDAAKLNDWLVGYCQRERKYLVPRREVQRFGPNSLRNGTALNDAMKVLSDLDRARLVEDGLRVGIQVNPAIVGV